MPIGSILLGLALLFGVGLFITRPFWMPERKAPAQMTRREILEAQKAVLLDEIKAVDFDYETGKIPAEVYQPRREFLVRQTADLLQEIDALGPAGEELVDAGDGEMLVPAVEAPQAPAPVDAAVIAEIEAAIARVRQVQTAPVTLVERPAPAGETNGNLGPASRFCSQCGQARESGDKFCAYCGHQF